MSRRRRWILATLACVLTSLACVAWIAFRQVVPELRLKAERTKSADRLRSLLLPYAGAGIGLARSYPGGSGKRFVLSLALWHGRPSNLEILFSPGDSSRSLALAGGPGAYDAITRESLRSETLDVDRLRRTSGPARARRPRARKTSTATRLGPFSPISRSRAARSSRSATCR